MDIFAWATVILGRSRASRWNSGNNYKLGDRELGEPGETSSLSRVAHP